MRYLILILLTSCSSLVYDDRFTIDKVKTNEFRLKIEYEQIPKAKVGKYILKVGGHATYSKEQCDIVLKSGYANACLLHEVLHCIYGNWHKDDLSNGEFCY